MDLPADIAPPDPNSSLDIIQAVFQRRLRQADLDKILQVLGETERAELLSKIGELLRRISALVEVSNRVSDTLSLDVLLPRLMEVVTEALNADRSTLFLHDPETDELFSRVVQGDSVGEIRIPAGAGIAGAIFRGGEALVIPDAYADPRFNQEVDRRTGYRTRNILGMPIRNKHRQVIGVTQVLNKQSGDFDVDDLTLLGALTSQATAALENAQLFERVEKARKEEAQLLDIANAISSELHLDALLAKIVSVATVMLSADRSSLFLFDARTGELWSRVAEGLETKEIRFPATAGIAGACFSAGEVLNIPDAYADARFNQAVDRKTGYRTRNILAMPIFSKDGSRLGVMQVLNRKGGAFGPADERRLRAFAAQAAIALENAQLFTDVKNARNYNESILKSLSNGVVTLDVKGSVIKINEAAARITGLEPGEAVGRPLAELLGEGSDWVAESVAKVRDTGQVDLVLDADLNSASGSPIAVNLTTVPLIDIAGHGIGCMLVMEDISREKRVKSTMSRYMTRELVERLLEGGESVLGGATQEVTILFSDIRSFTTISEKIGARETVSMLNDYFSEMVEIIFARNGILDKYIGDAIMALFGTPFVGEQDADNAVAVANGMMRALADFNRRRAEVGQPAIQVGVGVATGEVVAGNIGSPKRMEYTVIGDSVNLASRLEGANKFYGTGVLVSGFTVERLREPTPLREIDLIRVKGKTRPVPVYEALGHHTPESFPEMATVLGLFTEGLARYRRGDFAGAIDCFSKALAAHPGDGPSRLYLERARAYALKPPSQDWDGVYALLDK